MKNRRPKPPGVYSDDCIDIFDDGPGDNTIRPCRPERLLDLLKERNELIKWGYMKPTPLPPHVVEMLKKLEKDGKLPSQKQS